MANELLQTINRVLSGVEAERAAKTNEALTLLQMKQRADEAEANRLYNLLITMENQEQESINNFQRYSLEAAKSGAKIDDALKSLQYTTNDANSIRGYIEDARRGKMEGMLSAIKQNQIDKQNIASATNKLMSTLGKRYGEIYTDKLNMEEDQFKLESDYKRQLIKESEARIANMGGSPEVELRNKYKLAYKQMEADIDALIDSKNTDIRTNVERIQNSYSANKDVLGDYPTILKPDSNFSTQENFDTYETAVNKTIADYLSKDDIDATGIKDIVGKYKSARDDKEKEELAKAITDALMLKTKDNERQGIYEIDFPGAALRGTSEKEATHERYLNDLLNLVETVRSAKQEIADNNLKKFAFEKQMYGMESPEKLQYEEAENVVKIKGDINKAKLDALVEDDKNTKSVSPSVPQKDGSITEVVNNAFDFGVANSFKEGRKYYEATLKATEIEPLIKKERENILKLQKEIKNIDIGKNSSLNDIKKLQSKKSKLDNALKKYNEYQEFMSEYNIKYKKY